MQPAQSQRLASACRPLGITSTPKRTGRPQDRNMDLGWTPLFPQQALIDDSMTGARSSPRNPWPVEQQTRVEQAHKTKSPEQERSNKSTLNHFFYPIYHISTEGYANSRLSSSICLNMVNMTSTPHYCNTWIELLGALVNNNTVHLIQEENWGQEEM